MDPSDALKLLEKFCPWIISNTAGQNVCVQGYFIYKKTQPPRTLPLRLRPTVGSFGEAFSYERGTPVAACHEPFALEGWIQAGGFCGFFLRQGEVLACVGRNLN